MNYIKVTKVTTKNKVFPHASFFLYCFLAEGLGSGRWVKMRVFCWRVGHKKTDVKTRPFGLLASCFIRLVDRLHLTAQGAKKSPYFSLPLLTVEFCRCITRTPAPTCEAKTWCNRCNGVTSFFCCLKTVHYVFILLHLPAILLHRPSVTKRVNSVLLHRLSVRCNNGVTSKFFINHEIKDVFNHLLHRYTCYTCFLSHVRTRTHIRARRF